MDHPLRSEDAKNLRKQVIQLLKKAYKVPRNSNIVFVCGGNDDHHMRKRFETYFQKELQQFEFFKPEFAIKSALNHQKLEPFSLSKFEELIGKLSHAVVIFPEAAGSFAETGYFSARPDLSKICIVVMDSAFQDSDSFLSLGPVHEISAKSLFHQSIQIDYKNPDFSSIKHRLENRLNSAYKKLIKFEKYSEVSEFEIMSLIHEIVNLLVIATIDDIIYTSRAIFSSRLSETTLVQLVSILAGAKYILPLGDYGHFYTNPLKPSMLETVDGFISEKFTVSINIASLLESSDASVRSLFEEVTNVA